MKRVNLVLRLPKNIHTQLTSEAKKYSLSINTLIIHKLSGLELKQMENSISEKIYSCKLCKFIFIGNDGTCPKCGVFGVW